MTFKSTIETLSEAELDVVAGGMIKLDPDGNKHPAPPTNADLYQHPPIYVPKTA